MLLSETVAGMETVYPASTVYWTVVLASVSFAAKAVVVKQEIMMPRTTIVERIFFIR